mmetsp:Transcript_15658/g.38606  ORF Transcript_15658/g.38606 Transcript_15658/m.38606 type:complete len:291 (-) Transcript_15658:144-1016(-)
MPSKFTIAFVVALQLVLLVLLVNQDRSATTLGGRRRETIGSDTEDLKRPAQDLSPSEFRKIFQKRKARRLRISKERDNIEELNESEFDALIDDGKEIDECAIVNLDDVPEIKGPQIAGNDNSERATEIQNHLPISLANGETGVLDMEDFLVYNAKGNILGRYDPIDKNLRDPKEPLFDPVRDHKRIMQARVKPKMKTDSKIVTTNQKSGQKRTKVSEHRKKKAKQASPSLFQGAKKREQHPYETDSNIDDVNDCASFAMEDTSSESRCSTSNKHDPSDSDLDFLRKIKEK